MSWHPSSDSLVNDIDLMRAELDACRAEISRLRQIVEKVKAAVMGQDELPL